MGVVSRRWLSTLVSAEETSVQVEAAFLAALDGEQLTDRIDARLLARLRAGEATPADLDGPDADGVPVLIAMSDNGPQMRSHSTKEFMAACAIMQRFGRPGTPPTRPGSSPCSGTSRPSGRTWRRSMTPAS
jgi:putative transposase